MGVVVTFCLQLVGAHHVAGSVVDQYKGHRHTRPRVFAGVGSCDSGFAVLWYILVAFIVARRGQFGKMIMKLRIVNAEGHYPSIWRALLREVVFKWWVYTTRIGIVVAPLGILNMPWYSDEIIMFLLLYGALWFWLRKDANHQTLHDKIAGTFVFRN